MSRDRGFAPAEFSRKGVVKFTSQQSGKVVTWAEIVGVSAAQYTASFPLCLFKFDEVMEIPRSCESGEILSQMSKVKGDQTVNLL